MEGDTTWTKYTVYFQKRRRVLLYVFQHLRAEYSIKVLIREWQRVGFLSNQFQVI
jgi:hypothetical protein